MRLAPKRYPRFRGPRLQLDAAGIPRAAARVPQGHRRGSGRPETTTQSDINRPIRRQSGPARQAGRRSSRTRPTTWSTFARGVIVPDVEATSAHRPRELEATRTMIDRVEERFNLKPHAPDRRHGLRLGANAWVAGGREADRATHPGLGPPDPQREDATFGRSDFFCLLTPAANRIHLPGGQGA